MKNKVKKILCLVLSLAVVLTMAFTFAACDHELTDEEKEKLRVELISDASIDFSCAEITMTATDETTQTDIQGYISWDMDETTDGTTPTFNADMIFVLSDLSNANDSDGVCIMLLRGNDVYYNEFYENISDSDKVAAIRNRMSELVNNLHKYTLDEFNNQLSSQVSDLTKEYLDYMQSIASSDLTSSANTQMLKALFIEYFTNYETDDDGISFAFSMDKIVDMLWQVAGSLAATVDQSTDVVISTVYASSDVQYVVEQMGVSALEMETTINKAIEEINKQLPQDKKLNYTALEAASGETLYHYLGRYLEIQVDDTHTVGDLTIGDLLCMLFNTEEAPGLVAKMNEAKDELLPQIKNALADAYKMELNFGKDKQFVGMTLSIDGLNIIVKPLAASNLTQVA